MVTLDSDLSSFLDDFHFIQREQLKKKIHETMHLYIALWGYKLRMS